jgi:UDP-glucuronate 4-epimerase
MAYFKFAEAILNGKPIDVYNEGNMLRDFTYIDDITEGVTAAIDRIPAKNDNFNALTPLPSRSRAPFVIYNLGNNNPVKLTDFIDVLENALGRKAEKRYLGMQAGDVPVTMADIDEAKKELGWEPGTKITEGLRLFTEWFFAWNAEKGARNGGNVKPAEESL